MQEVARCYRAVVVAIAICMPLIGCGGYPSVSQSTYEHAKALYAATNQKSLERLEVVAASIDECKANKDLSVDEAKWLTAIVRKARDGDWVEANRECRQLMEDQIAK